MPEKKYILPESYTKCLIWNHYCLVIYYMLNVTIPDSLTFGWFTPKLDVTLLTFKNSAAGLWMSQFRHSRRVQLQDCATGLKIVLYLALKMLVDNSEKCKVESSPIHQQSECRNTLDLPPHKVYTLLCCVCKVCTKCTHCATYVSHDKTFLHNLLSHDNNVHKVIENSRKRCYKKWK